MRQWSEVIFESVRYTGYNDNEFMNNTFYRIFFTSSAFIICALLCVISYLLGDAHGRREGLYAAKAVEAGTAKQMRSRIASRDSVDLVASELDRERPGAPGSYEVIMNTEWLFRKANGGLSDNAYVENSRENKNAVRFTVALKESPEKLIYTSPVLKVGERLTDIKLESMPKEGSHGAVVTYELLDAEGKKTGEVKAGVTLTIE